MKKLITLLSRALLAVSAFYSMLPNSAWAQVPPCDGGAGNTLTQIDLSEIYVDVNSGNCKVLVPDLLGRWVASPGLGYQLISVSQAPSSSTVLSLTGGIVCPEGEVEVVITALFFYFGDPLDDSDDILCSVLGMDHFNVVESTPPSFMGLMDMTIAVTSDCDIDGADIKPLLKKANVKDNCTSKDYLVANSWVTRCDMMEPADPECPEVVQCWTFHIIDACGNENEQDVSITVTEDVAPVITLPASFTLNANSDCEITEAQLLALVKASHVSDNCTGDATLLDNLTVEYLSGEGCAFYPAEGGMVVCPENPYGAYCVAYQTTDACGNESAEETVNIYVKDVTAPVLTPPSNFTVCWPDPNYPFENFTEEPTVVEACDADCDITCLIYSQRILALTNPTRGAYGNNVYPTINIAPGPRVATVRVCARDLCGNGNLNPSLAAPLPTNCCTFNITLVYDEGCIPPIAVDKKTGTQLSRFDVVSPETGLVEMEADDELYLGAFPNPVVEYTQVYFNLPREQSYQLSLISQDGRSLYNTKAKGLAGRNVVVLDRKSIPASGVIYCNLETGDRSQTLLLVLSN